MAGEKPLRPVKQSIRQRLLHIDPGSGIGKLGKKSWLRIGDKGGGEGKGEAL